MTRIFQIIADGRPGGGTTAVLTLSRRLAAHGVEIVMATQQGSYLADQAARAGFLVFGLDFARRMNTFGLAGKIRRLLRDTQPALVHVHGGRAGLPLALIPHPCPVIYTVHGFHFMHKRGPAYWLAYMAEALCIARADCTVLVSDADREIADQRKLLQGRHQVIKNAVEIEI